MRFRVMLGDRFLNVNAQSERQAVAEALGIIKADLCEDDLIAWEDPEWCSLCMRDGHLPESCPEKGNR